MPLRFFRAVCQTDEARRIGAAAADLQKTVVAVLLEFLFVPDLDIEIGLLRDAACGFSKIFGRSDGSGLVNHIPRLVDGVRDERVPGQVLTILPVMSLEADNVELNLVEIGLFFFVSIEAVA